MNTAWRAFRKDRLYLTRYFLGHLAMLSVLILAFRNRWEGMELELAPIHLALLPAAILAGIQVPVLMHNCMHGNIKPRWVNEVLGEFAAFFALMGLAILRINHTFHHAHADTSNDPHDPAGKSFLTYLFVSQLTGARIIEAKYLELHGATLANRSLFKLNIGLHYGLHLLRLWVWFLLLGPEFFVAFYLPAFTVYSLAFAHVNYITHTRTLTGETVILNKDDNFYYKFINAIGSGVYYHRNHHNYPKLANPMRAPNTRVP